MSEKNIQTRIQVGHENARLFRINAGIAWQGKKQGNVLTNLRPVKLGVKGMSDLIGFTSVKITPEMVGKTVAVFTAIEVKEGKNKASNDQKNFILMVRDFGGMGGVARSREEALEIMSGKIKEL